MMSMLIINALVMKAVGIKMREPLIKLIKMLIVCLFSLVLLACATTPSPREISELQQGKRFFDDGYYKRAMHELLPIACDGNPDAQYGVGYMYYYGLGVVQDTEVGYFWIRRSANQRYVPAIKALEMMDRYAPRT